MSVKPTFHELLMSCEGSSKSPGVSSGIQEVSLDVVNLVVCHWMCAGGLQVSPAESRRYHWMSWPHGASLDVSSRSPGGSRGIWELSLDVVNIDVCLAKAPVSLQMSPVESRRYHWMSWRSWYVSGHLQQVSRCLQQNPGGIIGCVEARGMSLDVSSRSPGVSSRIQEVSLDVVNLMVCLWTSPAGLQQNPGGIIRGRKPHGTLWTSPAGLQVSPAESRTYHWM